MRVLIFHGYLLRGTGSNVYNASLARALAALGHDVHLSARTARPRRSPWIDAVGTSERRRASTVRTPGGASPGSGSITAYRPEIGGLLPVYVADRYEGFEVKTFAELSDAELDRYIEANVAAVRAVARDAGGIDAALANHLVMGPVILARAGLRFAAKVHGSALSYTVEPEPALPALRPGGDRGRRGRARRLPPHGRVALGDAGRAGGLRRRRASARPASTSPPSPACRRPRCRRAITELAGELRAAAVGAGGADPSDSFARDTGEAAEALEQLRAATGPRVIFVGKLIVSKGCDLLLAAWPLVAAANPGARLLMVGFGAYREPLERLWAAIAAGEREQVARDRGGGLGARGRGGAAAADALRLPRGSAGRLARGLRRRGRQRLLRRPARARRGRASCSAPARRWSSPAPSRRRSGWSPPRPRRPEPCPSAPTTRAWPRSPAPSTRSCPTPARG